MKLSIQPPGHVAQAAVGEACHPPGPAEDSLALSPGHLREAHRASDLPLSALHERLHGTFQKGQAPLAVGKDQVAGKSPSKATTLTGLKLTPSMAGTTATC